MNSFYVMDLATVIGLFFTAGTLVFSVIQYRKQKKHDKRKDTLEAYHKLQKEVLDKLYIDYTDGIVLEIVTNYRRKEYAEEYHKLGVYLARIEHFCVGINQDIYDWKTLYELAHKFFDLTIRRRIEILVTRKDSFANEEMYENLKKVWQRMDKETERRKKKGHRK